jgi:hypothetical protein
MRRPTHDDPDAALVEKINSAEFKRRGIVAG